MQEIKKSIKKSLARTWCTEPEGRMMCGENNLTVENTSIKTNHSFEALHLPAAFKENIAQNCFCNGYDGRIVELQIATHLSFAIRHTRKNA